MPSWSDYRTTARARGALAWELFIVDSRPAAEPQEMARILPDHLDYQRKMEAAGSLVLAGPLSDETGEQMSGGGMIVYRVVNMDEARAMAVADPMHARGGRTFKLRKWLVNEGSLTVSVKLSTNDVTLG
jgi:uncharacterized protein YciI